MLKGKDLKFFVGIILFSFLTGLFLFSPEFNSYSDIITFLSIIVGFFIASLAILYSSPLKKILFDIKDKTYRTLLRKLLEQYKFSVYFNIISVVLLFVVPDNSFISLGLCIIGKYSIVMPILCGSVFCFILLCENMFHIFKIPVND